MEGHGHLQHQVFVKIMCPQCAPSQSDCIWIAFVWTPIAALYSTGSHLRRDTEGLLEMGHAASSERSSSIDTLKTSQAITDSCSPEKVPRYAMVPLCNCKSGNRPMGSPGLNRVDRFGCCYSFRHSNLDIVARRTASCPVIEQHSASTELRSFRSHEPWDHADAVR